MSNNQLHGKSFEAMIKAGFRKGAAADAKRSNTSAFDIEASFDERGDPNGNPLPTQVKSCKSGSSVCMASAVRQANVEDPFRLLVLEWEQRGSVKTPVRIVEMLFLEQTWKDKVVGDLPPAFVEEYHKEIASFPAGPDAAKSARQRAVELNTEYDEKWRDSTKLRLNPKIDSKNQRRLQSSARLSDLMTAASQVNEFTPEPDSGTLWYRDVQIGSVKSGSREFGDPS